MRPLLLVALLAGLAPSIGWMPAADAQAPGAAARLSVAQAERNAVELKQGMSPAEVEKLLGKPRRTALKSTELQWTYVWAPERSLHVVFAAKTPEQWIVNGWDWSAY
jgi:hypothetical protein